MKPELEASLAFVVRVAWAAGFERIFDNITFNHIAFEESDSISR